MRMIEWNCCGDEKEGSFNDQIKHSIFSDCGSFLIGTHSIQRSIDYIWGHSPSSI